MPIVGDQLCAYVEVVVVTPNGARFVLWGDLGTDGVPLAELLQPSGVEVSYGVGLIPEIKFSAFVPYTMRADVLDSDVLNSFGSLWVRFHGSGGVVSPWWGGVTVLPDVSVGTSGVEVGFTSKGVSTSLSTFGLKKEFPKGWTVKSVVGDIFAALGIGEDRYRWEADANKVLVKPYAFERTSFWDDLCAFLGEYGMVIVDEIERESGPSEVVSKFIIRDKGSDTEKKEMVILRYMPGGVIGEGEDGEGTVLPILSFSFEGQILFAPGMGDSVVVSYDRSTGEVVAEPKKASKDSTSKNKGGKATVVDADVQIRGLNTLRLKDLKEYGFTGAVVPESKDGASGGGENKAVADLTKREELGAFPVEVGTIGALIPPSSIVYVDGICKKFDGRYWVKTVVHSGGDSPWETKLSMVKFGDDTEVNDGVLVQHDPSVPKGDSGEGEKQPKVGGGK